MSELVGKSSGTFESMESYRLSGGTPAAACTVEITEDVYWFAQIALSVSPVTPCQASVRLGKGVLYDGSDLSCLYGDGPATVSFWLVGANPSVAIANVFKFSKPKLTPLHPPLPPHVPGL